MKHLKTISIALLVFLLLLTGCSVRAEQTDETDDTDWEEIFPFQDLPAESETQAPEANATIPLTASDTIFNAKFEGNNVAGKGEVVDGVYRFTATKTDREAWHVKLECNYPTVAGRDYFVTYKFNSNVAGKIKFGDFQEFQIKKGENTVTGVMIASGGTSYLDLQLGMLSPFTIDFTEIEVKEFEDEATYENALPSPIDFERESRVYERHDSGYTTVLIRRENAVNVNYLSAPMDSGVWKSRLYIRTGLVPEPGVRYRVTADAMCDEDMPFELLFNNGDEEKGYGALYDQKIEANKVKKIEAVVTGNGNVDELILQASLGEAPDGGKVIFGNVNVEKITDGYKSILPADFRLDNSAWTGRYINRLIPIAYEEIPLNISYDAFETVYEQHDEGYVVELKESYANAFLKIKEAPAKAEDRGVWKVRLYAATGVDLVAGKTYRVKYDLVSNVDQADYEACFDGNKENAYGVLYGRSLKAGQTDHVEQWIMPETSSGPLTLRLQLGKTDTAAGNKFLLSGFSLEEVGQEFTNVPLTDFSYDTQKGTAKYQSVLPEDFSYKANVNVTEEHAEGYTQSVSSAGDSATLDIQEAPENGRDPWNSNLLIDTGVTPEANTKYVVSYDIIGTKDQPKYETCFGGIDEKTYGALYDQSLISNEKQSIKYSFTPENSAGELRIKFKLGQTNDVSGNSITISNLKVAKVTLDNPVSVLPEAFKYPTVITPEPRQAGYYPVDSLELNAWEEHDSNVFTQSLSGTSLSISEISPATWMSKLFVEAPVEKDAKYKVTIKATSNSAIPKYEFLMGSGRGEGFNEKAYIELYSESIDANGTKEYTKEFTASTDKLLMQFLLGKSPAGTTFSISEVVLEKWEEAYTPGEEDKTVVPGSFELWAMNEESIVYKASLGGDGNSATTHLDAVPAEGREGWKTKLFANTGVTLKAGKTYRISVDVKSSAEFNYEICYNNGGEEKGAGNDGNAALYNLTTTPATSTLTYEVSPNADKQLVIQFSIGMAPADTTFTVNNIKVEEFQETEGENLMTDPLCAWAPVHQFMDAGYSGSLSNDASSATLKLDTVSSDQADWKVKLFVETGAELKAGKQYRISYKLNADKETAYHVFYNNGAEEKGVGEFYNLKTGTDKVEHTVTPGKDAVLNIQLMLGNSPASNNITISDVNVEEIVSGSTNPPINSWTHEDYVTSLTNTDSSATMNIEKVPASGRESWKIKLFAETHQKLEAGKTYRVSVDVQSASSMGYEICYNNAGAESELGTKPGLNASSTKQTVTYNVSPSKEAELTLQFNLGNAAAANSFTISNIKIEDAKEVSSKNLIPNFRYNAVGYLNGMADEGYVTSFRRDDSSATFKIKKAPDERNPWNAKVTARTGFTPEAGKGYRVSVDVTSNVEQKLFEIFYDGDKELDYGALYEQKLPAGTKTFSYIIYPGDSKGELVLQLRFGKTDDNSGNKYVINNIKVEEVTFTSSSSKEIKNTAELVTQSGYNAELIKSADRASVRLLRTPKNGREAWKNKLFVYPGVKLEEGQKYRITAVVKSIIPAPFEICLNDGDVEKGLGGIFGLMSRPQGAYITYASYVPKDIQLAVQLSLGNCVAPNTITLSDVKVEKAGKINQVSDKIYIFR